MCQTTNEPRLTPVIPTPFDVLIVTREEVCNQLIQPRVVVSQLLAGVDMVVDTIRWITIRLHIKVTLHPFCLCVTV